ncbi:MAG: hypothetical protein ABIL07_01875 [candidate division WOR-3 bacterium]
MKFLKPITKSDMQKIKQRDILLDIIKGYDITNTYLFKEKKQRLKKLSVKDSILEYIGLCRQMEKMAKKEDFRKIDEQKIEVLLKKRRLLNKIGKILENQ